MHTSPPLYRLYTFLKIFVLINFIKKLLIYSRCSYFLREGFTSAALTICTFMILLQHFLLPFQRNNLCDLSTIYIKISFVQKLLNKSEKNSNWDFGVVNIKLDFNAILFYLFTANKPNNFIIRRCCQGNILIIHSCWQSFSTVWFYFIIRLFLLQVILAKATTTQLSKKTIRNEKSAEFFSWRDFLLSESPGSSMIMKRNSKW